jgi:hypothetical protein
MYPLAIKLEMSAVAGEQARARERTISMAASHSGGQESGGSDSEREIEADERTARRIIRKSDKLVTAA